MRAQQIAAIIGLGCCSVMVPVAFARPALSVSTATPENYNAVKQDLDKIPPYLKESQCGGWDARSVEGTIATVKGVPGRDGIWDGAILTGMATRKDENGDKNIDNDFKFPDTTKGLTTACSPNQEKIKKTVWREGGIRPGEIVQVDITYPHPMFEDPSCRWRRELENGTFSNTAPIGTEHPPALDSLDSYNPKPKYGQLKEEPLDRQSPPNCKEFCEYLNTYQYYDCLETATITVPVLGTYTICLPGRWGNKWLCSDQKASDNAALCMTGTGVGDSIPANARTCTGPDCRCQGDGGPNPGNGCKENPGTKQQESPVYYSYYRFYKGEYSRDAITPEDKNDKASDSAPVACYGFYDEFDPKFHQTQIKDRRCVIDIEVTKRQETQKEKGEYGQNSSLKDRDPNDWRNQRGSGSYNQWKDVWFTRFSGGFSLLNERVFSGSYNNNLTNVFLDTGTLDTAKMRATEQISKAAPFATGSFIRSFDDTGERNVVSWWQTQQNTVAQVLHPPIIRMILPSGWAMGIDPNDPFFSEKKVKILKPTEKREDRIEVQIDAEDDTLGAVLAYLERSLLLHVVEEPIPAIVPVGTATEFRAKAEAWCTWVMRRDNTQDCKSAPADVDKLMKTLEAYATDIEKYRLLRAELPKYAAKILALQENITKPISDWMLSNINAYRAYLSQQKTIQAERGAQWRNVQETYETFGSQTNMPWCMNQRFTLPVYSLLDEWLPSRIPDGDRTADKLPIIPSDAHADIVIDLSAVAFMSGTIVLPVLDPVQVRVTDFPSPPSPNETKPVPAFPPLPSIAPIQDALKRSMDSLPKPETARRRIPPINIKPINQQKIDAQKAAISEIGTIIGKMDERYKRFWTSIGPFKPYDPAKPDAEPEFDPENKNGVAYKKPKLECLTWDDSTCQHVEMDLRERFMRIASRPLVFLKEDYQSKDEPRGIGGPCVGQEDVCSPLHPEEGGEKHLWEIIGPRNVKNTLETLRTDVRKATLPEPVGGIKRENFPHYGTETGTLLAPFDVPRAIDLFVPRSSASSSSS